PLPRPEAPQETAPGEAASGGGEARPAGLSGDLRERERQLILEVLRAVGGNRKVAAQRLGISPRTLRYKLARLREAGVPVPEAYGARCA
ncbi:MAG: sigma-54-dependent Fis family transcriptional regulator, partial [Gammaproteobacteria bacterium]